MSAGYRNGRWYVDATNGHTDSVKEISLIKRGALFRVVRWIDQAARHIGEAIALTGAIIIAGMAISVVIGLNLVTDLVCTMFRSEYRA